MGGGQWVKGSGWWAVGGGQWVVGSGWWAVGNRQWVKGRQMTLEAWIFFFQKDNLGHKKDN